MEKIKSTKEPEAIESFFKKPLFDTLIQAHGRALPYLQTVAEDFETLAIGHIVSQDFEEMISGHTDQIRQRYFASLEAETGNIKSPVLRGNLMEGTGKAFETWKVTTLKNFESFRLQAFSLGNFLDEFSIKNFSIKGGTVSFTEENKERIRELCTIYVESDLQKRYVLLANEALKLLKELKQISIDNNLSTLFSYGEPGLFDEVDDQIFLTGIQYVEYIKN